MIVDNYFDLLWPRFLELKQRVTSLIVSAQLELVNLNIKLGEYQSSLTTGTDFVR